MNPENKSISANSYSFHCALLFNHGVTLADRRAEFDDAGAGNSEQ